MTRLPRTDWREYTVPPATPVRDALAVLDKARQGVLLVARPDGTLLGTVTDGDVRRALLRQVPLDVPVATIMSHRPSTVAEGASATQALSLMTSKSVRHLPVVDEAGRIRGLFAWRDLTEPPELPNWVVVMAGGEGRRLRPLTERTPKPMLPVNGRPILESIVEKLVRQGFRHVFLSIHYLGDHIRAHFADGARWGCSIRYLEEPRPLGTGGALGLLPEAPEHALVVMNGDLVTDVDLASVVNEHVRSGNAATMCVREFEYRVPYGVVRTDGGRISGMEEKPAHRVLINAGIYVLDPSVAALVPRGEPCSLPDLLERVRAAGRPVGAFPVREAWIDIGHLEEYRRAAWREDPS